MLKRAWVLVPLAIVVAVVLGWVTLTSPPAVDLQALPVHAVPLDSPAGQALLEGAVRADHAELARAFVPQQAPAFCGVASAVIVLRAAGRELDQDAFFIEPVLAERSWWRTTFTGMPLAAFGAQVAAHGLQATVRPADLGLQAFRDDLAANLAHDRDWLVVNFDRGTLGEQGGGHFSPISAWSPATDQVLLLDTAAHKYPAHWVPIERLYDAMHTVDSESGTWRGWVLVAR